MLGSSPVRLTPSTNHPLGAGPRQPAGARRLGQPAREVDRQMDRQRADRAGGLL